MLGIEIKESYVPRATFDAELNQLKESLLSLGTRVANAQKRAVEALAERDEELARQVIADDAAINRAAVTIEEQCLFLIASQQPVARDLRMIVSASAIATELERMGDHAKGVAVLAQRLIDQPLLKPLIDVPRMAEIGRELLIGQLKAFLAADMAAARRLAKRDDEVDQLNEQVFRELLLIMMSDPRTITRATYLLWVSHNLERFADRTTNIGERVVFLTTSALVEFNEEGPERDPSTSGQGVYGSDTTEPNGELAGRGAPARPGGVGQARPTSAGHDNRTPGAGTADPGA